MQNERQITYGSSVGGICCSTVKEEWKFLKVLCAERYDTEGRNAECGGVPRSVSRSEREERRKGSSGGIESGGDRDCK